MKTISIPEHRMDRNMGNSLRILLVAVAISLTWRERGVAATINVSFGGGSLTFNPKTVTINVGDTVMWTNAGGSHTVTGDGADPFCGTGFVSTSCSHTFNTAGTFGYHCIPHASFGMTGTVIVQAAANTPPSVTITNPANGAVFAAPANVTVKANATDADGTVTTVRLLVNDALAGTDSSNPYSIVASNLAAGSYALKAVAVDNGGLSTTSAVVNISVVAPVSVTLSPPLITNSLFRFNFSADAGLRYVIESSPDLFNWTAVTTNTATSSNERVEETFDVNLLRFYRVGRLPNP